MHSGTVYGVICIELKREIKFQFGVVDKYACARKDIYTQFRLVEEAFNYSSAQRLARFYIMIEVEQAALYRAFNFEVEPLDIKSSKAGKAKGKIVRAITATKRSPNYNRDIVRTFPDVLDTPFKYQAEYDKLAALQQKWSRPEILDGLKACVNVYTSKVQTKHRVIAKNMDQIAIHDAVRVFIEETVEMSWDNIY